MQPNQYTPYLIANPRIGLERDVVPFLLPDDAYPLLENAYLFRGRILKKGGTTLLGRLGFRSRRERIRAGAPDAFSIVLPAFERGTATLTDSVTTFQDDGAGNFVVTVGAGIAGTVDYATFTVTGTFTGAVPASPYIISSWQAVVDTTSPCMGLKEFETSSEIFDKSAGFDTLYAYRYNESTFRYEQLWNYVDYITTGGASDTVTWSGSNSDFFRTTNWSGAFWVTNFVPGYQPLPVSTTAGSGDGIRWYADSTTGSAGNSPTYGWVNFCPPISATNFLLGARFVLQYKSRLLFFNTWEGANYAGRRNFGNRIRWSQIGTPFYAAPVPAGQQVDASAWRQDVPKRGSFLTLSSEDTITAVEIVKDDLIVYCERSRYRIVFTGDSLRPFIAQQIEDEFGCESPDSLISLDRSSLSVSFAGVTITDGVNTERIDEIIPTEVFNFHNGNNGNLRVQGARDFYSELCYWTFVNDEGDKTFPNRMLVYNYKEKSWAIFDTQWTALGTYYRINDLLWSSATQSWSSYNINWGNPSGQSEFPFVIGGNQHGYVHYLENGLNTFSTLNDYSLSITGITTANPAVITIPQHNLEIGQWIRITGVVGTGDMTDLNTTTEAWQVYSTPSNTTITVARNGIVFAATGTYTYGGQIALLDNFMVETKRFPIFMDRGMQTRLGYVDFLVDAKSGQADFSVDFYDNEVYTLPLETQVVSCQSSASPTPERIWVRAYFNSQGQFFALRMYLSNAQMQVIANDAQQMAIHALNMWLKPSQRWVT